eukprot:202813_1
MTEYPTTLPYVYCGLAEASYKVKPIEFLRQNYQTNIDQEVEIKERNSAQGWDYILFENKQNNTLIIAFRGTDISKQPSDIIDDLYNEIGSASHKPIFIQMSKNISNWLDKYNNNNQYKEVSFVGHSEGGLYARYVLQNDNRINFRITFNTVKPENIYNFRSKDDPITLITGFVKRQKDILFKRREIPNDNVWTICPGEHGIHYFNKIGVLIDENNHRKTWDEVKALRDHYKQQWIGDGHIVENILKRWWNVGQKREHTNNFWWKYSNQYENYKLCVVAVILTGVSIIFYRNVRR